MLFEFLLALTYPTLPDRPPLESVPPTLEHLEPEPSESQASEPVQSEPAQPAPEHLEYAIAPGTGFDGVVLLEIKVPGTDIVMQRCTGSLLTSGRHILTAANCVLTDPAAIQVVFHLIQPTKAQPPNSPPSPTPEPPLVPQLPEAEPEPTLLPEFPEVESELIINSPDQEPLNLPEPPALEPIPHLSEPATTKALGSAQVKTVHEAAVAAAPEHRSVAQELGRAVYSVERVYFPHRDRDQNGKITITPQCIQSLSPESTSARVFNASPLNETFSIPESWLEDSALNETLTPSDASFSFEQTSVDEENPGVPELDAPLTTETIPVEPHCASFATLSPANFVLDGDIAVLELSEPAPAGADRYSIYRQSDEKNQVFLRVGYGDTGNGVTGAIHPPAPHCKYFGSNRYDADGQKIISLLSNPPQAEPENEPEPNPGLEPLFSSEPPAIPALDISPTPSPRRPDASKALVYDFDSGSRRHDVLGYPIFGLFDAGLSDFSRLDRAYQSQAPCNQTVIAETVPPTSLTQPLELLHQLDVEFSNALPTVESGFGPGDEGSPAFLAGKIAGIASHSLPLPGLDRTGIADGSFGEIFFDTRVSDYASFIDEVIALQAPWADQR
ncbi:MAG: hypothetical protein F6J87_05255 [Spirulina sp. SIO3F2]|nr:hypothetical protein [Spirulina sp. SIO3F2]